jgi:hypothetical protein
MGTVVLALAQSASAQESQVKAQKINPNSSVKSTLTGGGGSCVIIEQNGHTYKVCPYKATPEIQSAIQALEGNK